MVLGAGYFWGRLSEADYPTLLNEAIPADPLSAYIVLRASIVLGQYARARECLAERDLPSSRFLHFQLAVYQSQDRQTALATAPEVLASVRGTPLLEADFHFVMGYLHNLLSDYRRGLFHQREAYQRYDSLKLPGPAAASLFNLCVAYNYLGESKQAKATAARLDALAERFPFPSVRLHQLRFQSYEQAYREDYEDARQNLEKAVAIARESNRLRDEGGLLCFLAYLLFRLNDEGLLEKWRDGLTPEKYELNHQAVMNEFLELMDLGLPTRTEVERKLTYWTQKIDSVNNAFLVQALLDRTIQTKDYTLLARTAHMAGQNALAHNQSLVSVDYRYHEILGLARSGRTHKARELLAGYQADARDQSSQARAEKALLLAQELEENDTNPERPLAALCLLSNQLTLDGRTIDLAGHPLAVRLLSELIQAQFPLPIDEVFQRVYEAEYHPLRNGGRLNTLIHRTRKLLGLPLIHRKESMLSLDKRYGYFVNGAHPLRPSIARRREQVADFLQRHPSVRISELEKHFPFSRRTIQSDLAWLRKRDDNPQKALV